jgi:4-hydroxy-4-methyl-2-oxoglutarate aldolase
VTQPEGTSTTIPQHIVDGFRLVPPATIGHVRASGFVDPAIRPIYQIGSVVVGRAVTLKLAPGDVTHTRAAIDALGPGDVLVIDQTGACHAASWGEMTSLASKLRGAVGVVVDGACTDILEIAAMKMPTFSRGITALVGRRLTLEGGVNVPVQCGGVVVNPGDLVVADDNGIVVIPAGEAEGVYATARAYEDRSAPVRRWLLGGGALAEVGGLSAEEITVMADERGY